MDAQNTPVDYSFANSYNDEAMVPTNALVLHKDFKVHDLQSLNSDIKRPYSYPKHVRNESKDISSKFIFSYDTGGLYVSLELGKSLIPAEIGQAHFDILTLDRLMSDIERTHIPTDDEDEIDF